MKPQDEFRKIPSLNYSTEFQDELISLKLIKHDELVYLNNLGFSLVIKKRVVSLEGNRRQRALLILKELDYLKDKPENFELADYLRLHNWHVSAMIPEILQSIKESMEIKPYKLSYFDIIQYILDNYKLDDKGKERLKQEDAEYWQKMQKRNYQ